MSSLCADFASRRRYVQERLVDMGLEPWEAAGGFFYWAPVPGEETGEAFAQRLLTQTGVLVNPGRPCGPAGERFIRISYATDEGRLREGLNRLEGIRTTEAACGVAVAEAARFI